MSGDLWERYATTLASALWDESPALTLLVDPATSRVLDARGSPLLGAPPDALRGLELAELDPGAGKILPAMSFGVGLLETPGVYGEVCVQRRDGRQAAVSLRVHHIAPDLLLLRVRDVELHARLAAELRKTHAQLQQAFRELQEQRRSLDEARRASSLSIFAAGLAHELNNPLGALMSTAGSLREYVGEVRDAWPSGLATPDALDELPQIAAEMRASCERVVAIVRRLRELERPFSPSPCELIKLLREIGAVGTPVQIAGPASLLLETDPDALARLLGPVLDNARRASDAPVQVTVREGLERVEIEVLDLGPGVAPEIRERIFDPFFSTRPPGSGVGLGLFLARRAASALGGDLVLTQPGPGGTAFTAVIPRAQKVRSERESYEGLRTNA